MNIDTALEYANATSKLSNDTKLIVAFTCYGGALLLACVATGIVLTIK